METSRMLKRAAGDDGDDSRNTCSTFCAGQRTPLAIMCYIGMAASAYDLIISAYLSTGTLLYSTRSYNIQWAIIFGYAAAQFVVYSVWMGLKKPAGRAADVRARGRLYAAYWMFTCVMLMGTTFVWAISQSFQSKVDGFSLSEFENGFCNGNGTAACVCFISIATLSSLWSLVSIAAGIVCVLAEIYTF